MRKLLQINSVANQGSTGKIAEQIGRIAIQHKWESYIAYGRGTPKSESHLVRIGNNADICFHVLQSRLFDNHGRVSVGATKELINTISLIKPDVIHLHNIHGYYLNYELLFDYLADYNCPLIWTLHDCWAFTGHCAFFDYPPCDKWTHHCEHCPSRHSYPTSFFLDQSRENYNRKREAFLQPTNLTLVPVSNWLDKLLNKSFLRDVPSRVIHNGVDTNVFRPFGRQDSSRKVFRIISVAYNWSEPRKGLNDLIELRRRLSSDFTITIVGLNENEKRSLPEGITGIIRTSNQEELAKLYSMSDALVLPTYEDNFPSVILESLASGTPVVTYDTGGCSEALNDKVGCIVPKGDLDFLTQSILSLREKTFSRALCREWALENFDERKCYESYFDLYNRLLDNSTSLV